MLFVFCFDVWPRVRTLDSNKPTHYLLHYGDLRGLEARNIVLFMAIQFKGKSESALFQAESSNIARTYSLLKKLNKSPVKLVVKIQMNGSNENTYTL